MAQSFEINKPLKAVPQRCESRRAELFKQVEVPEINKPKKFRESGISRSVIVMIRDSRSSLKNDLL